MLKIGRRGAKTALLVNVRYDVKIKLYCLQLLVDLKASFYMSGCNCEEF